MGKESSEIARKVCFICGNSDGSMISFDENTLANPIKHPHNTYSLWLSTASGDTRIARSGEQPGDRCNGMRFDVPFSIEFEPVSYSRHFVKSLLGNLNH